MNDKMVAGLKRVFGANAQISVGQATLSDPEMGVVKSAGAGSFGPGVRYYAVSTDGRRVGYGIIDDVRGKSKLITYAVMVDVNLVVKDLEVLFYREPYGGEIQYDSFRRQFRGKSSRDGLRVGGNIRNISGATISSNSVTNGTRKLLVVLQQLNQSGKLR